MEWLIQEERYGGYDELHKWLHVYKVVSDTTSKHFADNIGVSRPVANRAIAPTGALATGWNQHRHRANLRCGFNVDTLKAVLGGITNT